MTKNEEINEILNQKEIKNPKDLFQVIDCVYKYGRPCNEYGDELVEKLFCLLTGRQDKEYKYGRIFFRFIIQKYSPDNKLEMLLAISGISDDYKKFSNATECREEYSKNHNEKYPEEPIFSESGMRKREKTTLKGIANKVYSDFRAKDDRLFSSYKEWIVKMKPDPKILDELEALER